MKGAQRGLELLNTIDLQAVTSYQPYWAVRAHLLKGVNRYGEAVEAFDRALGLADDAAVRRQLARPPHGNQPLLIVERAPPRTSS